MKLLLLLFVGMFQRPMVEKGFEETLNGTPRLTPPTEKLLDGEQEARVIAMRLGPPPKM